MALKINKQLTTTDGQTIPSGCIVVLDPSFRPLRTMRFNCSLFVWLNQDTYTNPNIPYMPSVIKEFESYIIGKTMDENDYLNLSPHQVHIWAKSVLESWPGIGANNVEIIL